MSVSETGMQQGVRLQAELSGEPGIAYHTDILQLLFLLGRSGGSGTLLDCSNLLGCPCSWCLLRRQLVRRQGEGRVGHCCLQIVIILYDAH